MLLVGPDQLIRLVGVLSIAEVVPLVRGSIANQSNLRVALYTRSARDYSKLVEDVAFSKREHSYTLLAASDDAEGTASRASSGDLRHILGVVLACSTSSADVLNSFLDRVCRLHLYLAGVEDGPLAVGDCSRRRLPSVARFSDAPDSIGGQLVH